MAGTGQLVFDRSDALTVGNAISGGIRFTQQGVGIATLTGDNKTYSGTTTINAGSTLRVGSGDANVLPNGSGTAALVVNGTLDVNGYSPAVSGLNGSGVVTSTGVGGMLRVGANGTSDSTFAGQIEDGTGTLTLAKLGTRTLTLTGVNTYSGGTTIGGGTLTLSSQGSLGTGDVEVEAAGTLRFSRSGTTYFDNSVSGAGAITQTSGTLVLRGDNDVYSGAITVSVWGATLQVGDGGTAGTLGAGTVAGTGQLVFDRSDALTVGNAISGGIRFTQQGAGIVTLAGNNTYTGTTSILQGELCVNGSIGSSSVTVVSGTLSGIGGTGPVTVSGGSLAPGEAGSGSLMTGSLTLTSGSTFRLGLTNDGAGQLVVSGTVNLGNAILDYSHSSASDWDDVVVVIDNDGLDAVTGTFFNLEEGSEVIVDGVTCHITYCYDALTGQFDVGNDVALVRASGEPVVTVEITGLPTYPAEGTPITLGSAVTDPAPGETFTYAWTVTKNGAPYASGSDADLTFTPDDNATYAVALTVTDSQGGQGTATETILVANVAPTVEITGVPANPEEGTLITLGSIVTDPGALDTFTYAWEVTKNGSLYATGSDANRTFTPDDNATYVVTLTVTDKDSGQGTATETIEVANVAPTVEITGIPANPVEGTPITLGSIVTDPGVLDTFTYAWEVTKNGSLYAEGTDAHLVFTPDAAATYAVSLAVTDNDGGQGMASAMIVVPHVPSLIAHWRFDETSGTSVYDASGHAHTGELAGGAQWTADGMLHGAIDLDGNGQYVQVTDSDLLDGVSELTVAAWVFARTLDGETRGIVSKRAGVNDNQAYSLYFGTGNKLHVEINGSDDLFESSTVFQTDRWYHVAVTFDGSLPEGERVKLYVDGVLDTIATESSSFIPDYASDLTLGILNAGHAHSFDGRMDEVRIYPHALSSDAIRISTLGFVSAIGSTEIDEGSLYVLQLDPGECPIAQWVIDWGDGTETEILTGNPAIATHVYLNGPATHRITVTATDGTWVYVTSQGSFEVNVYNVPPLAVDDTAVTVKNAAVTVEVLLNDSDPGGDTLFIVDVDVTETTGSVVIEPDGTITYDPTGFFDHLGPDDYAVDTFLYTVADGDGGTATAQVTVYVYGHGRHEPVAVDDFYSFDFGTGVPYQQTVQYTHSQSPLHNDFTGDGEGRILGAEVRTSPAFGTVAFDAEGFTFTPTTPDFTGYDRFTYVVIDGGVESQEAHVTIEIVNGRPRARDESFRIRQGGSLSVPLASGLLARARDDQVDPSGLELIPVSSTSHGTLTLHEDAGRYTGAYDYEPYPGFVGTDVFTYRITNGASESVVYMVQIDVTNTAPVAVTDSVSVDEDTSIDIFVLLNDWDFDGNDLAFVSVEPPRHGTVVNNGDGTVTYTPPTGYVGHDALTYTISDGAATVSGMVLIEVRSPAGNPPTYDFWAADDLYFVPHGQTLNVGFANGVLSNDFHEKGGWLEASLAAGTDPPAGLTFFDDGSFTYVAPSVPPAGPVTFVYEVTDGSGTSATATFAILVTNQAPSVAHAAFQVHHADSISTAKGDLRRFAHDADGDALEFQRVDSNDVHGTLVLYGDGTFTYTPDAGYTGTASFEYRAFDGAVWSAAATVTIDVTNSRPLAADRTYVMRRSDGHLDICFSTDLLLTAGDADGDPLTAYLDSSPGSGGTVVRYAGMFRYQPPADFAGKDTFSYFVSDGAENSHSMTITIEVLNTAPDAFDSAVVSHDFPNPVVGTYSVWDADGDSLETPTVVGGHDPQHGSVEWLPANRFRYTPTPGAPYFEEDSFTFTVSDGIASSREATITVYYTNLPPVAASRRFDVTSSGSTSGSAGTERSLLHGAWDPDGDSMTVTQAGTHVLNYGTLTVSADGSWTYLPEASSPISFAESFSFTVTDDRVQSEEYVLTLVAENARPVALGREFSFQRRAVSPSCTFNLLAGGAAFDPDGDDSSSLTVAFAAGQDPKDLFDEVTHSFINATTGQVTLTFTSDFAGEVSFAYIVNDGLEDSEPANVTVRILNQAPIANDDWFFVDGGDLTVNSNGSIYIAKADLLRNDYDPDGDAIGWLVDLGSLSGPGSLTWQGSWSTQVVYSLPSEGPHPAAISFTYKVVDPTGAESESATVTLTFSDSAPWSVSRPYQLLPNTILSGYGNSSVTVTIANTVGATWLWDIDCLEDRPNASPTLHDVDESAPWLTRNGNTLTLSYNEPVTGAAEFDVTDGESVSGKSRIELQIVENLAFTTTEESEDLFSVNPYPNYGQFEYTPHKTQPTVSNPLDATNNGPFYTVVSPFGDEVISFQIRDLWKDDLYGDTHLDHCAGEKTISIVSGPTSGSLQQNGQYYTYTPFVQDVAISDSFEYEVAYNGHTATATVYLWVVEEKEVPGAYISSTPMVLWRGHARSTEDGRWFVVNSSVNATDTGPIVVSYDGSDLHVSPFSPGGTNWAAKYALDARFQGDGAGNLFWSGDAGQLHLKSTGADVADISISGNLVAQFANSLGDINAATVRCGLITENIGNVTATRVASIGAGGNIGNVTCAGTIYQLEANGNIGNVQAGDSICEIKASGSLGNVTVTAGSIGSVRAGTVTGFITAGNGSIYKVLATAGDILGAINASQHVGDIWCASDILGNVMAQSGSVGRVEAHGDIGGSITANQNVGIVTAYGTLSGDVQAIAGSISRIRCNDLSSSAISAGASIGEIVCADNSLTQGGSILGTAITAANGFIGNITADGGINADISATQSIGTVWASKRFEGSISGSINAGLFIEEIKAQRGGISAAVLAVTAIGPVWARDDVSGNISGASVFSVTSQQGSVAGVTAASGGIGDVSAGTSITGSLSAQGGNIGAVIAGTLANAGNIGGNIEAGGSIYRIDARGSNQSQWRLIDDFYATFNPYFDQLNDWLAEGNYDPGNRLPDPPTLDTISPGEFGHISGTISAGSSAGSPGSIGAVAADGAISGNISAGGRLPYVWAVGDVSGNVSSGAGPTGLTSLRCIAGNLTTAGNAVVHAGRGIEGDVASAVGSALVRSWADVAGSVVAQGDVIVNAFGAVGGSGGGQLTTAEGSIFVKALGDVSSAITAAAGLSVETLGVLSAAITAGLEYIPAYVTAFALTGVPMHVLGDVYVYSLTDVTRQSINATGTVSITAWGSCSTDVSAGGNIRIRVRKRFEGEVSTSNGVVELECDGFSGSVSAQGDSTDAGTLLEEEEKEGRMEPGSISLISWGDAVLTGDVHGTRNVSILVYESLTGPGGSAKISAGNNAAVAVGGRYAQVPVLGVAVESLGSASVVCWGHIQAPILARRESTVFAKGNITADVTVVLPPGESGYADQDAKVTTWGQLTGNVTGSRHVTVFACGGITGNISAGGNVNVVTNGTITGNVTAGDSSVMSETTLLNGHLYDAIVLALGTIEEEATFDGNAIVGSVTASQHVGITAYGGVAADVTATEGNVVILAYDQGGTFTGTVRAGKDVGISVAQSIEQSTVYAGEDVELTAHRNLLDVTIAEPCRDVRVSADGKIENLQVQQARDISLGAVDGITGEQTLRALRNVVLVSHAAANVRVDADGDVSARILGNLQGKIDGAKSVSATVFGAIEQLEIGSKLGNVTLLAMRSVDATVTALKEIEVTALGNVAGTFVTHVGDASVNSLGSADVTVTAAKSAHVRAAGNVSGNVTATWGSATVISAGSATPDSPTGQVNASVTARQNAHVAAYGGDVNGNVSSAKGNANVVALGNINGTITAGAGVEASAGGNLNSSATVQGQGKVAVTALGEVDANVTSKKGSASVVAGTGLTGNVQGYVLAEARAMTGDLSGNVSSNLGQAYALAGGTVSGAVSAPVFASASALSDVTGTVTAADGSASVRAAGGNVTAAVSAGRNVSLFAYGDVQAPVNAGQDAHLLVMGTPLAPVAAGRNLHLTAHGPISAAINPTAGKNARVWSFGNIDANVTATTGDADVMTWGALNSLVVAGGYAALWSHGDADVTVHSGDFASLRTYGTAAVEINAGLDAYVWAGKEVTGSIQTAGFAGLTSLNHYDGTPATTAVSINSSGGDVAVWTLADFTGPVNAAASAWIVTLGGVTLNNTHVGGDLLVFAVDDANVNASAGGHLMIASWGDVPLLGATGDAGAAVWCYGHLTGTLASAEGFASAVTLGDGDLANVSSGTDLYVAALGTLTVNASAGEYGTLWAGGILDGTATAGASLLAVSLEDVQLINTSAGRDLAVVAAGRILGNYTADRDLAMAAYNKNGGLRGIEVVEATAGRDIVALWSVGDLFGIFTAGRDVLEVDVYAAIDPWTTITAGNHDDPIGRIDRVTVNGQVAGTLSAGEAIGEIRTGATSIVATLDTPVVESIITDDTATASRTAPLPNVADLAQIATDALAARVEIDTAVTETRTKAQQVRDDKAAERLAKGSELQQDRDKALAERDQALADAQTERTTALAEREQELLRLRQEEKADDDRLRASVCGVDFNPDQPHSEPGGDNYPAAGSKLHQALRERQEDIDRGQENYDKYHDPETGELRKARDAALAQRVQFVIDSTADLQKLEARRDDALSWYWQLLSAGGSLAWTFTPLGMAQNIVSAIQHVYERGKTTYGRAVEQGAGWRYGAYQTSGVVFYEVSGAMGLYQAIMGEDPLTLQKFSNSERLFRGAQGALQLATMVVAGAKFMTVFKGPCSGYIYHRCFVGDTEVLLYPVAPGCTMAAAMQLPPERGWSGADALFGPVCLVAGLGMATALADERRRRREEHQQQAALDALFGGTDLLDDEDDDADRPEPPLPFDRCDDLTPAAFRTGCDRVFSQGVGWVVPNVSAFGFTHAPRNCTPGDETDHDNSPWTQTSPTGSTKQAASAAVDTACPTATIKSMPPHDSVNSMSHTPPARKRELPPAKPRRGRPRLWAALAGLLVLLGCGLMFRQASELAAPCPFTAVSASPANHSTPANPAPKYATKAIRDFRGFEWVLARNPEVGDEERSQFDAIDYREWRWVELELTKPDGDLLQVGLGRPMAWLAANDIEAGATTWLDLEEMGAVGCATVVSIAPCPDPGPKPHPDCRLVTGVFRHSSADCVNVHVAGLDAPIGTTGNHRFWSEDRQAFVEASHLLPGETLLTADSTLTSVLSITPRPGLEPVYNLEVDVEHVYYVSSDGILVHNVYGGNVRGSYWKSDKRVFPTSRTTLGDYRVRGKGRGGRTIWEPPKGFDLRAEQAQWVRKRYEELVTGGQHYSPAMARKIVEGQILQQARSPASPFLKRLLDGVFGE
ncbi:MAG: tandem-95 repeat protein [Thermoguttaceae bacterium]|nr:tandem-95 repeat protein [Thermoguttaceae bacterium]